MVVLALKLLNHSGFSVYLPPYTVASQVTLSRSDLKNSSTWVTTATLLRSGWPALKSGKETTLQVL